MRENRQSGSEGGGTEPNRFSLPLSGSVGFPKPKLFCLFNAARALPHLAHRRGHAGCQLNWAGKISPNWALNIRACALSLGA